MIPSNPGEEFIVKVKPGGSTNELISTDPITIRLRAPPVDGKANEELVRFIKKTYGVRCVIISGNSSKSKKLRVLA